MSTIADDSCAPMAHHDPELRSHHWYRFARRSLYDGLAATVAVMRKCLDEREQMTTSWSWLKGNLDGQKRAIVSLRIAFDDWEAVRTFKKGGVVEIDSDALAAVNC